MISIPNWLFILLIVLSAIPALILAVIVVMAVVIAFALVYVLIVTFIDNIKAHFTVKDVLPPESDEPNMFPIETDEHGVSRAKIELTRDEVDK